MRLRILATSLAAGGILVVIGFYLLLVGKGGISLLLDLVVIGIAIALIPHGVLDYFQIRRASEIERRLPDFLKDVAESSKFGTNLAESIVYASSGSYGILTAEIKRIAAQIQWGITVSEALENFIARWPTPFVSWVIRTVIQTNKSGGNVSEVLNIIADNSLETQLLAREKSSQLNSYVVILIMAFGVYLLTIVILNVDFFPQMIRAGGGGAISGSLSLLNIGSIPTIKLIFAGSVIVYGIGNGLMAGVLKDGRMQSGFLMASALVVIGYSTLAFMGGV